MAVVRKSSFEGAPPDGDRPLTARSVLASTLLGTDPPELSSRRLVAVAALFGISENSARVALSRMVAAGEVEAIDGRYRLAGHLLARHARQDASRRARTGPWQHQWVLVTFGAGGARPAAERAATRRELERARLAEHREGVWLRPDNLAVELPTVVAHAATRFLARPEGDPVALAGALWDLEAWSTRADRLRERLAASLPALHGGDPAALAPGFVLSASVLRHLQADPLLPDALLPPGWPGPALRAEYDSWDAAYRAVLRTYHRDAG